MGRVTYKQWNKIISILLLSVVMFQVLSKIVWQHSHVMEDGRVITHTHPYSKSTDSAPIKNHYHSGFELLFLHYLENLTPILTTLIALTVLSSALKLQVNSIIHVISFSWIFAPGRSPPVL